MSSFGRKHRGVDEGLTPPAKTSPSAYDKALGWLARREYSRRELSRKLDQGGYAGKEAGDALERLEQAHYQDDERFARMLVRRRAGQGYGPLRIGAELQSHGIGEATIRQLLDEADQDWDALAAAQAQRRYGGRPAGDAAEQARRGRFLLRRGFSGGSARKALAGMVPDESAR